MTSVPPSVPTFTLANVNQIMAQVVQTALAKAQRLRTIPDPQKPPCYNFRSKWSSGKFHHVLELFMAIVDAWMHGLVGHNTW